MRIKPKLWRKFTMIVSAWSNGGSTYGVRVGIQNRDDFFNPSWNKIEVEMDGTIDSFFLTKGFWNKCPEFRDCGNKKTIKNWLNKHKKLKWAKGQPPKMKLVLLSDNRFRLVP